MTDKQPEALRLADCLEELDRLFSKPPGMCAEAAAELRRLHEVNAELVEALIGVVRVADRATVEFAAAKGAIAKATGKQLKTTPVWYFMRDNHTFRKLTGSVESMLAAINEEISAGYTSGSVFCRELKIDIHCNYKNTAAFTEECRAAIAKATGEQQ